MGILVKRSVRVRVIVTDDFRARRTTEIRTALAKLDAVRKRIEFELESATKRPGAGDALAERLRTGLRNNERARSALGAELDKLAALETGSEYDRGTLDGLVEVEVGDDFAKIASCDIVVKDDKIVEVREGQWPQPNET